MSVGSLVEIFTDDQFLGDSRQRSIVYKFPPDDTISQIKAVCVKSISFLNTIPNIKTGFNDTFQVSLDGGATKQTITIAEGWYTWNDFTTAVSAAIAAINPLFVVTWSLLPISNKTRMTFNGPALSSLRVYRTICLDVLGFDSHQSTITIATGAYADADRVPNLTGSRKVLFTCSKIAMQASQVQGKSLNVIASINLTAPYGSRESWEARDDTFLTYVSSLQNNLEIDMFDENGTNLLPYVSHSISMLLKLYR